MPASAPLISTKRSTHAARTTHVLVRRRAKRDARRECKAQALHIHTSREKRKVALVSAECLSYEHKHRAALRGAARAGTTHSAVRTNSTAADGSPPRTLKVHSIVCPAATSHVVLVVGPAHKKCQRGQECGVHQRTGKDERVGGSSERRGEQSSVAQHCSDCGRERKR